ncbi:GtrA family protein [Corynebacterium sp. 4HC-13]|uniref:GtrA family protein n=1 Tax=Corynebacterium anserum TaxID=2684406 RepID=UPI00163B37A8|nr:GtrA family protein [Corynebacterium anserum]MBC2682459.1 GtrA family protein [Corynebacterium anserum]
MTEPTTTVDDHSAARRRAATTLNTELFRFILVGGFSAIVDFGSTAVFTFLFNFTDGWAKTGGFILGTLTAYLINRRWTFRAEPSVRRFLITMATYGVTFAVQWTLYNKVGLPLLTDWGWEPFWVRFISFVFAQGVATVLNFLIQKFLIFRT